jgi:HSP20 family protein
MTLVKYRPTVAKRPFDNLFDDLLRTDISQLFGANELMNFNAKVNIKERDTDFELEFLVPGFSKKDIEITVEDNSLTVKGELESNELAENERYTRKEHVLNSFTRKFDLPESIDGDKISAEFKNGVLTVLVPKMAQAEKVSRSIKIS